MLVKTFGQYNWSRAMTWPIFSRICHCSITLTTCGDFQKQPSSSVKALTLAGPTSTLENDFFRKIRHRTLFWMSSSRDNAIGNGKQRPSCGSNGPLQILSHPKGLCFYCGVAVQGACIPTLQQVLTHFQDTTVQLFLELKGPGTARPVYQLV